MKTSWSQSPKNVTRDKAVLCRVEGEVFDVVPPFKKQGVDGRVLDDNRRLEAGPRCRKSNYLKRFLLQSSAWHILENGLTWHFGFYFRRVISGRRLRRANIAPRILQPLSFTSRPPGTEQNTTKNSIQRDSSLASALASRQSLGASGW